MRSISYRLAAAVLLVALAAFFRLHDLNGVPPGFHRDEAADGNDAITASRTGNFRIFYPDNGGREGLVINLQALVFGLTGVVRPWVVRLPSALLGTLTIIGVYLLARQSGLRRTAWLAAWLMAASFWHVNVSRLGTRVAAAPCFLVWSLYLWGTAANPDRRPPVRTALAGMMCGFGFYTYPASLLTPLIVLPSIVCGRREARPALRAVAIAGVAAVVVALPLMIFACRHPDLYFHRERQLIVTAEKHRALELARATWKTAGMFNVAGDNNPRHNIPERPMLFWPVGFLFLIGVARATMRGRRWLLWWLAVGVAPAIVAIEGAPHALRSVMAVPAAFLLVALGAEWAAEILDRSRRPILAPALAGILALVAAVECYRSYFVVWARDPKVAAAFDNSWVSCAKYVDSLPQAAPKYLIFDRDATLVRGLPSAAQTVMFLTDTATADRQEAKNLFYLSIDQTNEIPAGSSYVIRTHEVKQD